jgi:hypothetical protein
VTVAASQSDIAAGWDITQGTTLLRRQTAIPNVSFDGPASSVTFQSDGRISGAGRMDFRVRSTTTSAVARRCVVIDLGGRAAVRSDQNGDGNCVNG